MWNIGREKSVQGRVCRVLLSYTVTKLCAEFLVKILLKLSTYRSHTCKKRRDQRHLVGVVESYLLN